MTKILCISDEIDSLVYSQNVRERYADVDFIIGAGDLELAYYGFIVSSLNKPLYFIFGNHHLSQLRHFSRHYRIDTPFPEPSNITRNFYGSTYIGEKVVRDRKSGLILAGFGGSFRYNNGQHQYSDFQMWLRVLCRIPMLCYFRLRYGRWVDIVVTHAPPRGIHDKEDRCHRGFKAFLWFMRVFKPRYLLHGHIHLLDRNESRSQMYASTEVINIFGKWVLEVEQNHGSSRYQ